MVFFILYLVQSQPFNWARLNISLASTTPPLNTTLFLWFQISDTIATHNPFHALLTLCLWPNKQKLWKLTSVDSCLTPTFLTHLSHWSQTCCTTLQVLNKWSAISIPSWHKGHYKFPNWTPLLAKLNLVGILSSNNLQPPTKAEGATFKLHTNLKISEVCNRLSPFKIL